MLGIFSKRSFMLGVIAGVASTVLAVICFGYYMKKGERNGRVHPPAVATKRDPVPAPQSDWSFTDEVDPVTKSVISKASAYLQALGIGNDDVAHLTWSCPERMIDTTTLEIATFRKSESGKLEPLVQSPVLAVEWRFDGEVRSETPTWPQGVIARDYENTIKLRVAAIFGAAKNPGRFTTQKPNQFFVHLKDFYITDTDFVARIPVDGGRVTIQFSLDDPMIKKLLTECGFAYGEAPGGARSKPVD